MQYTQNVRLTIAQQFMALQLCPACLGRGTLHNGRLTWEFPAQPTPLSRQYLIRIVFQQGGTPKAYVVDPNLSVLAEGKSLPHVYEQNPTQLCLYLPGSGEWSPSKKISETIVPWSVLWLFYFEDWLASGEWKGGGQHPSEKDYDKHKKNSFNRRRRN